MSKLKFRDYLRIHIDIPTVVIILLFVLIVYRQVTNFIFQSITFLTQEIKFPSWTKDISLNVISEFVAVVIFLFLGYLYFRLKSKPFFAGEFIAYEITKTLGQADTKTEWGNLKLTYNIFSKRIKGILRSNDGQVCIQLEGEFDKERYFRGTYIEKDKPSRLRLGAFLMLLDSNGDNYEGAFMHVSPTTKIDTPEPGHAIWEKVKS